MSSPNWNATAEFIADQAEKIRTLEFQLKDGHSRIDARGIAMLDQHDIGARIEGLCKAWATEERKKGRENERLRLALNGAKLDAEKLMLSINGASLDALCWKTQSEQFEARTIELSTVIVGLRAQMQEIHERELFLERQIETLKARLDLEMDELNERASENARLRFLIEEAITSMSHAEIFIHSREKMHPQGIKQWGELLDRMRIAIDPPEPLGNESAKLVGGE